MKRSIFSVRTTIRAAPAVCRNCTRTSSPRPATPRPSATTPSGWPSITSTLFDLYVATRRYARRQTYDDVPASGLSLFGTPDAVAARLARLAGMGVDHVMGLHNFGRMPRAAVLESMRALAQEALPRAGTAALIA